MLFRTENIDFSRQLAATFVLPLYMQTISIDNGWNCLFVDLHIRINYFVRDLEFYRLWTRTRSRLNITFQVACNFLAISFWYTSDINMTNRFIPQSEVVWMWGIALENKQNCIFERCSLRRGNPTNFPHILQSWTTTRKDRYDVFLWLNCRH
jgi:hypothetical protein